MANRIYLLKTSKIGNRERCNALPFQKDESGKDILTNLNVQANMEMRRTYPLGTVFATKTLMERPSTSVPFYSTGEIYPVSIDRSELKSTDHEPTEEMVRAYNNYLIEHGEDLKKTADNNQTETPQKDVTQLSLLEKLGLNPRYEKPTVDKDGFYVDDDTWWDLVCNIIDGTNFLLKGPAGTGKTELLQLACKKMDLDCHIYDMGSMYDPISDLLGVHRMTAQGSVFDYAQFTQDIQKPGLILLDELSRATAAVNNILMPCLDSRRTLRVEMAGSHDKRIIPVHPKCVFAATANIGAEYTGTNELDAALRDRFYEMDISYLPVEEEINMLVKRYKIAKVDATNIVMAAQTVRVLAEKQEVEFPITTRETIRAAKKVAMGWPVKVAMERAFLPRYEGNAIEGSKALVKNAILAR